MTEEQPTVPKVWQPELDLKACEKVNLPALQPPKSDHFLRSVLQRKFNPKPDGLKLRIEVHGIFSMPDPWRARMVSNRQTSKTAPFQNLSHS